jgi:hypothetical protein
MTPFFRSLVILFCSFDAAGTGRKLLSSGLAQIRELEVARHWHATFLLVTQVDRSAIFDFELSSEEMAEIGALTRPGSQIISRSGLAPDWGM